MSLTMAQGITKMATSRSAMASETRNRLDSFLRLGSVVTARHTWVSVEGRAVECRLVEFRLVE